MKIGLIDVDGHNFPNIPLMKLSAYWKSKGAEVDWYSPLLSGHCDKVYMSKVFTFTKDYEYAIDADEVERGGTGYAIKLEDGVEHYHAELDPGLPHEIEHMYPDYGLYGIDDCSYGFLTRGCPRGCPFCHVAPKEGRGSHQVAELDEFWRGQKKIVLCDPNILACRNHEKLLQDLAATKALVDINQGVDCRLLTKDNIELLNRIRKDQMHFAWDHMRETDAVLHGLELYAKYGKRHRHNDIVYCLVNFDTTWEEDLYRVYKLREMDYRPFIMIYDKEHADKKYNIITRWTNNRFVWNKVDRLEDYTRANDKERKKA